MHLKAKAVIAENDKRDQRARHTEYIGAEDHLLHRSSAADASHKEGGRHCPDHPVSPEEYGPVLREIGLPQRVCPCTQRDKILHHIAKG